MRSDRTLSQEDFRGSQQWNHDPLTGEVDEGMATRYGRGKESVDGQLRWHSFSGHERNCLFLNQAGNQFKDVSAISGADSIADGRAFAIWDYDHDGWRDLALTNANRPLLNLYRNRMHKSRPSSGRFIAIRLVGGNQRALASSTFSSRDAYGAQVAVRAGGLRLMRELRCGEGFAAQNSDTMLVGVGDANKIDELIVTWPSGKSTSVKNLDTNQQLIAYEDSDTAPGNRPFETRPYVATQDSDLVEDMPIDASILSALPEAMSADLHLIVTTATWCEACKRQLPQLKRLRDAFSSEQLRVWAVPADAIETKADLMSYVSSYQPAYQLLVDIDAATRERVLSLIRSETNSDALPSSILLDRSGRRLRVMPGVPSVSDVARVAGTRRVPSATK